MFSLSTKTGFTEVFGSNSQKVGLETYRIYSCFLKENIPIGTYGLLPIAGANNYSLLIPSGILSGYRLIEKVTIQRIFYALQY